MAPPAKRLPTLLAALASLRLTLVGLSGLMVVVAACTLAQARLGNYEAVRLFIRSPLIRWRGWPVFPGGASFGLLLLVNLSAAQATRLELSRRKAGLWLTHLGLIVLFAGEFVAARYRTEGLVVLREGSTRAYLETTHEAELAVEDGPWRGALPESLWRRQALTDARLPFRAEVVSEDASARTADDDGPVAARVALRFSDGRERALDLVEGQDPRLVSYAGRTYALRVQPRRYPLGYSLTLKRFTHEVYPGSDIPKSYSSLVELSNPATGEDRDALISMNKPLRYRGRAFYQASFMGSSVSVLQVVDNPAWTLPYAACALMAFGLLLHFAQRFGPGGRRPA